jgi:hypothetical protein
MHTEINMHQNAPMVMGFPGPKPCSLVLNHPRKPASSPRTTADLALLNDKGKHAFIKNK